MGLFKIKIWDKHETPILIEGEEKYIPKEGDDDWKKFYYFIDTDEIRISGFREFIIFDKEDNSQPCIKIYFTDESHVLGRYTLDRWLTRYKDVYIPMIITQPEGDQSA